MILLHDKLPCSDNYFRYFKNYDKYMEEQLIKKSEGKVDLTAEEQAMLIPQHQKSPVREIQSPKYDLGLSPIERFMTTGSPNLSPISPAKQGQGKFFNIDTFSQRTMLLNAHSMIKKDSKDREDLFTEVSTKEEEEKKFDQVLQEKSMSEILSNVPIEKFSLNELH